MLVSVYWFPVRESVMSIFTLLDYKIVKIIFVFVKILCLSLDTLLSTDSSGIDVTFEARR